MNTVTSHKLNEREATDRWYYTLNCSMTHPFKQKNVDFPLGWWLLTGSIFFEIRWVVDTNS